MPVTMVPEVRLLGGYSGVIRGLFGNRLTDLENKINVVCCVGKVEIQIEI